jgi:hypothetical protein
MLHNSISLFCSFTVNNRSIYIFCSILCCLQCNSGNSKTKSFTTAIRPSDLTTCYLMEVEMDIPVTSAPAADKQPEQIAINMGNEGNGENELFGTPNVSYTFMFRPFKGMRNGLDVCTKSLYDALMICMYSCCSIMCGSFLIIFWSILFSMLACIQVYLCQPWFVVMKLMTNLMLGPLRYFAKECCLHPVEACCDAVCVCRRRK